MLKYLVALLLALPLYGAAQGAAETTAAAAAPAAPAAEEASPLDKLAWQKGPSTGKIAGKATIAVPAGYVFLDQADTSKFLEFNGNPPSDGNYMLAPESLKWFSVFSFDESGYVKDDEKIDADALLKSLKDSDAVENEERQKLNLGTLNTVGWQVAPHYDAQSKRLEWGLHLKDENSRSVVNYTTRILGRSGVMRGVLVSSPEDLAAETQAFKTALAGFSYDQGEKYAEFKEGDKIAEYGLAALVLGGAAAVATKKGFFGALAVLAAKFGKLIFVAVAALFAGVFNWFRNKK